jgi:hypothetical protein
MSLTFREELKQQRWDDPSSLSSKPGHTESASFQRAVFSDELCAHAIRADCCKPASEVKSVAVRSFTALARAPF